MKALASRIFVALLLMTLAACIILPLSEGPSPDTRQNITDQVPTFIVAGVTTRAEVLLRLGEPDGTTEHDLQFTYTKGVRTGGLGILMCGGFNCGGGASSKMTYDRLTIQFDDKNVVTSSRLERISCWEHDFGGKLSSPCANVAGRDLLAMQINVSDSAVFPSATWCTGVRLKWWQALPPDCPIGTLVISTSAILFYADNADSKSAPMLTVPYTGIASAEMVKDMFSVKGIAFKRADGTNDSITIGVKQGAGIIDSQSTERAGELLMSRWRAVTNK
ncbi:hypothetical protein QU487_18110 [Crenobacter sp. SG2305]|uniref:hypothetical protein n=1 Tax=Crenobacter oryzisoli TaxID=3056844 RepID=UPI0025AA3681|nr:hypothetical protein [Crenobacter sp. SG2305]MDN0084652.1 hypothetical protein [Crenobacter sp. SG2305]